ncbi:MraZ, partial [mine drainage metagenome]
MFMGEFRHSLDDKGRLFIPARMRDELGPRFVITKGLDRCLFLYSGREWEGVQEKLGQLPLTSGEARAFSRFFFSGANECEPDKQGR